MYALPDWFNDKYGIRGAVFLRSTFKIKKFLLKGILSKNNNSPLIFDNLCQAHRSDHSENALFVYLIVLFTTAVLNTDDPQNHKDKMFLKYAKYICSFTHRNTSWWHHDTSGITGPLWGESTGHRSFDIDFGVSPNKLLNKQSNWPWFETPQCSYDVILVMWCVLAHHAAIFAAKNGDETTFTRPRNVWPVFQ